MVASPHLIGAPNPNVNWDDLFPGTRVTIPDVEYPAAADKAAVVKISLQECVLETFDDPEQFAGPFSMQHRSAGGLPLFFFVETIALDPNYTFNPAVFPESAEAQAIGHKLIIPPGPNKNPVGVAWIGLDPRALPALAERPAPEQVGRTESHRCSRLANWNAAYLTKLVWVGMPVVVE